MRVPRLWTETIQAHRAAVKDAVLDAVADLVAEHGLAAVTMTEIADRTGIGRATLYKYFPDVEGVLVAWHERQISHHLARLTEAAGTPGTPGQRLHAVLEAYALHLISQRPHGTGLAAWLHRGEHIVHGQQQLHALLAGLIAEAAKTGEVRDDIPPGELAGYCLHALTAAGSLSASDAVRRLVALTMAGLHPPG
jgi:AcrR family transcriptional regulator